MTLAIEPMVTLGDYATRMLDDKWTVVTADGSLSAHFEHTVALTKDGPRILTRPAEAEAVTAAVPGDSASPPAPQRRLG